MSRKIVLGTILVLIVAGGIAAKINDARKITKIKSDYCVFIKLDIAHTNGLKEDLREFSARNNISIDNSNPASIVYSNKIDSSVFTLFVRFGEWGSLLSHYSIESDGQSLVMLKSFVEDELSSKFNVTSCHEVKGFKVAEYIYETN